MIKSEGTSLWPQLQKLDLIPCRDVIKLPLAMIVLPYRIDIFKLYAKIGGGWGKCNYLVISAQITLRIRISI